MYMWLGRDWFVVDRARVAGRINRPRPKVWDLLLDGLDPLFNFRR